MLKEYELKFIIRLQHPIDIHGYVVAWDKAYLDPLEEETFFGRTDIRIPYT